MADAFISIWPKSHIFWYVKQSHQGMDLRWKCDKIPLIFWQNKVNRCLARYSPRATTTNWPTNRAPKKPAWPDPNRPKCQFWAKLGRFWAKNPFFTGEIKSFVTHITENPPRHLVCIDFWSGMRRNGQKMPIFGLKWPKMQFLDEFRLFLGQNS